MFRKHEKTIAWKAGLLALLVHAALVAAMLISFAWKTTHTVVSVSDVELWTELPDPTKVAPPPPEPEIQPEPEVEEPEPEMEEPEPEPELEPEPEVEEPEPKVDIELEKKKKVAEEKKRLEEEKKKQAEEKKKKLAEKKRKKKEKERRAKLKKLQQAAFDDDVLDQNEKRLQDLQAEVGKVNTGRSSAAIQGEVDKYIAKIQAKIRGNVNKALCGDDNPQLIFKLNLLPTGDFGSSPKLTKSSGAAACDDAVERAIIASEPLPLPKDPDVLSSFRHLNLKFRPND